MKLPVKRILLFLLPFTLGLGTLFLVVGTQDLVSPLPGFGSRSPAEQPRGEGRTPPPLTAGPATMKGVRYLQHKTLPDGSTVKHYEVHLGSAQVSTLGSGLNDLRSPQGAMSQEPDLILFNQKPEPELREVARVHARLGRAVPYEKTDEVPSPKDDEARLRELEFREQVLATIFDPTGNDFLLHTERMRVVQVGPNPKDPKFEVSSDTHVLLTKKSGGLQVTAEGFLFQVEQGLLTLMPPVHAEGIDFSLPPIGGQVSPSMGKRQGGTRHAADAGSEAAEPDVPVTIECRGKSYFHRLDEGGSAGAAPISAGSLVFNDDVLVRRGPDWFRGDRLRLNLKSMRKEGATEESLQPSKCWMESSGNAPVLFHVSDLDGESQGILWSAADNDVVLAGPCHVTGGSMPALTDQLTPGADGSSPLVMRAQRQILLHQEPADGRTRMTLSEQARVEDTAGRPLLQGSQIEFLLTKSADSPASDARLVPTSVVALGGAVLDVAGSHIEGRRVEMVRSDATSEPPVWDLTVNEASTALISLPPRSPGEQPAPMRLTPLAGACEIHRSGGKIEVTGRATARIEIEGGGARELTANRLSFPEPQSDAAERPPLHAVGVVVLDDPTQGLHLESETLDLPLEDSGLIEATGRPVVLHVHTESSQTQLQTAHLFVDRARGLLRAEDGAELRMPSRVLAGALAGPVSSDREGANGEATLHCDHLELFGSTADGAFHPQRLVARGGADLSSTQGLSGYGETLDLDLVAHTGFLSGSAAMPAQITQSSELGRPLQTMAAPLILLEESGKALHAPTDGVVWMWSVVRDGTEEEPRGDGGRSASDRGSSKPRYVRMAARKDLVLSENRVTAREDVQIAMEESDHDGAKSTAKEYFVRADAADADLVRTLDASGQSITAVSKVFATGRVRLTSSDLRARSDVLQLEFSPDGHGQLSTLTAEGRGRPCWIEHLGREMFTSSVFVNVITHELRGERLSVAPLSP